MAVVLVEGFDAYNGVSSATVGSLATTWSYGSAPTLVAGRFGGQAARTGTGSGGGNLLIRSITPLTQGTLGFAIKFTAMPSTSGYINMALTDANGDGIGLYFLSTGAISLISTTNASTPGATYATTAGGIIVLNAWHYVELEFTIANAGGILNLYVDGNLVSSGTYDTLITSSTVSFLYLGPINSVGTGTYLIDDLYVTNTATRLGEQRVETLYPSADTAQLQWTPSTGSNNYGTVDETLMSSTDFVSTNVLNNYDLYDFTNLSSTANTINAVTINALAQKDNVGTRTVAMPVKSGSTTSDGANNYLSLGYKLFNRVIETDPNTAAAWTVAGVNALQAGIKVTI